MKFKEMKARLAIRKAQTFSSERYENSACSGVKSLAVVLDCSDEELKKRFLKLGREIGVEEKGVKFIYCSDESQVDATELTFTPSELTWKGNISKENVKEFLDSYYEVMICFTQKDSLAADFISTVCRAGIKVGRKEKVPQIYDLCISSRFEEVAIFIEELKNYIRIIKKID